MIVFCLNFGLGHLIFGRTAFDLSLRSAGSVTGLWLYRHIRAARPQAAPSG